MITPEELAMIADATGGAIRAAVAKAKQEILVELETRTAAMPRPKGERGDKGEKGDVGEAGPTGQQGERGEIGPKGERGEIGENGPAGPQGQRGENGMDGKDGRDGREGKDGTNGRDGLDGKDALELDILSSMDPKRSYPRNTYIEYDGGLIRSLRQTTSGETIDPSEWSVLLSGLAEYGEEMSEDCRSLTVWSRRTLGQKEARTYRLSHPQYREIWKPGEIYYRGQFVTSGGSLWFCSADSTEHKPGTAPSDWILAAKAGRDGKDLRPEDLMPRPNGPVRLK